MQVFSNAAKNSHNFGLQSTVDYTIPVNKNFVTIQRASSLRTGRITTHGATVKKMV